MPVSMTITGTTWFGRHKYKPMACCHVKQYYRGVKDFACAAKADLPHTDQARLISGDGLLIH